METPGQVERIKRVGSLLTCSAWKMCLETHPRILFLLQGCYPKIYLPRGCGVLDYEAKEKLQNGSVFWKATIMEFDVIGKGLA
jgi:hypothetical protein